MKLTFFLSGLLCSLFLFFLNACQSSTSLSSQEITELTEHSMILFSRNESILLNQKRKTFLSRQEFNALQTLQPVFKNLMWRQLDDRIGSVALEWKLPTGREIEIGYDGPLDKPKYCQYNFKMPLRSFVEKGQTTDQEFEPSTGEIRFERLQ